jgi:L-aminopeptidase/D-esterase-like protein
LILTLLALTSATALALGQTKLRARDLGIPFQGTPGPLNAITDVTGIEVGHTTLIEGEGPLRVGEGPVRTGVTVVFPRGKQSTDPVFAGWFSLNGNGEMTGTTWVEESGFLDGPLGITNTHSVGAVHQALIAWSVKGSRGLQPWSLPVVAETWDGYLNDINGFHVTEEDVFAAIDKAAPGPVPEGNVGGGTGMICYAFKGGIGTASRQLPEESGGYTVGVLVQANFGLRYQLMVAGVPVGREITEDSPWEGDDDGSIIIVVATNAPLLPHQLKRLARRAGLGIARTGGTSNNSSGDIFIAFSTANAGVGEAEELAQLEMVPNSGITPIFEATVQATEEAIINALVAAETMTGRDGNRVIALPHDRLREVMQKYNRLRP